MKQNDLIVARTTRACTTDEFDYLQYLLKKSVSPRKRVLKAILNALVLWGFLLLGILLASGILSYLTQYSEVLATLLAFANLQILAIFASAFYALFSTYQWLKGWENPYSSIQQDINSAEVIEETYHVKALYRFQEPEMGGFIYCLKISDQDFFVLYDYQSQDDSNSLFLVQKQFTLVQAPHCGHYLDHHFKGEHVTVSATYPLTLPVEQWPLADTWLPLSKLEIMLNSDQT